MKRICAVTRMQILTDVKGRKAKKEICFTQHIHFFFFNLPPLILKKIQVCLVSFKTSHVVRGSKLWSQIYKLMLNRISHFDGIFYCICIEEIRSTKDLCL